MEIKQIKIEEIIPYGRNSKKHPDKQVIQIAESIKEFGFNQPIVVDKNNVIIVGHGRFLAGHFLGLKEVPVLVVDIDEEKAKAYRLADNKLNESDWDMELVITELKELSVDMVNLTGFDKELLLTIEEKDNYIPELKGPTRSKIGDIYQLGEHKIMCGDSQSFDDVKMLMNEKNAKLLFTSPPYNMNGGMYESYNDNLKKDEYINFNMQVVNVWKNFIKGFIFWNISYNKNSRDSFIDIIYRIIKETGLQFLELIVWNKKTAMPVISKNMLTRQYEDILVVGDDESINQDIEFGGILRNSSKAHFNKKTQKYLRNYWEISPINSQLDNHKACFPVELPFRAINIMTEVGELVNDPFLGSGTTLIACEKTNRICYGMELDPNYIDITIQRWCEFTNNRQVVKNGEITTW